MDPQAEEQIISTYSTQLTTALQQIQGGRDEFVEIAELVLTELYRLGYAVTLPRAANRYCLRITRVRSWRT